MPFVNTKKGVIDRVSVHWEMAAANRKAPFTTYSVWTLRLVGIPSASTRPTEFRALDLQPGVVDHETALRAYKRIAERTGIRLVDKTLTGLALAEDAEQV